MANPTTNYSFAMPTNTDLVKDLPADFEIFGQAVDTQMKTNADAAIAKTIVDAKGDIIAATAADTVSRLAVGANDTVLTADSSTATGLKWAAPASGGMTLISTTTLSGASVVLSSIPSTYVDLYLLIFNTTGNTNNRTIRVRPNGSSSNARYSGTRNGTATYNEDVSIDLANQGALLRTDSDNTFSIYINNYASSTARKPFILTQQWMSDSSVKQTGGANGVINNTSAISSITIDRGGTDTFAGGTVLLYGVK